MAIVELKNVTKKYGSKVALDNVNIAFHSGRIVGLLGPNGSGKTTLIKLITGLLTPQNGEVLINGQPPSPTTKSKVAYLPDKEYLPKSQKIKDIIKFYQDFYLDFDTNKAYALLSDLKIDPELKYKTLSKGMKEKVQLVLVMSRNAEVYLLDEPIGGVDPASRDYILQTIIRNYNPNATVIISTHLINDIEGILDDIVFINYARIGLISTVDHIREQYGKSVDSLFREVYRC